MHHHLRHRDRVAIATLLQAGHSQAEIAAQLRLHRSTLTTARALLVYLVY
jgi:IS30 family transposase